MPERNEIHRWAERQAARSTGEWAAERFVDSDVLNGRTKVMKLEGFGGEFVLGSGVSGGWLNGERITRSVIC